MRKLGISLIYGLLLGAGAGAETPAQIYGVPVLKASGLTARNCENKLGALQTELQKAAWYGASNEKLKLAAAPSIQNSWKLRLALHDQLPVLSRACSLQVREIFHQLRDNEDYWSEFANPSETLDPKNVDFQTQPVPIYDRAAYPSYLVRKELDTPKFQFKSGDLMLARGISFVSAIISQVSDNRSHFSHLVTVQVDEKTKTESTVESYIGSGVERFDMPFALKNENARLLVLRPRNQTVAKVAAEIALTAASKHLPYDYQMDYQDAKAMSCAEVPVFAFAQASEGKLQLPTYTSSVRLNNPEFLSRMGLRPGTIITPDDLEIDPNFQMVLDWKDLRLIRDSRHKDALLSEMVRWLSDLGYNFHDDFKSYTAMYFIKPARSTPFWPWIKKWTSSPTIDEEVPRGTLGLMVLIAEVGDKLVAELRRQDKNYISLHQRPMTNRQLRNALEDFRLRDLKKFQNKEASEFHFLFRP